MHKETCAFSVMCRSSALNCMHACVLITGVLVQHHIVDGLEAAEVRVNFIRENELPGSLACTR